MRYLRQLGFAALVGAGVELMLAAPLFLVRNSLGVGPLPLWVEVLQEFQVPGAPLVLRLLRTDEARQLAARLPSHWVIYAAQLLEMLIQATMFALVALGIIYVFGLRKARSSPPCSTLT